MDARRLKGGATILVVSGALLACGDKSDAERAKDACGGREPVDVSKHKEGDEFFAVCPDRRSVFVPED